MLLERQGEADLIIDMMSGLALSSLLPRGIKTWHSGDDETTIDLVLASEELKEATLRCTIHETGVRIQLLARSRPSLTSRC